MNKLEGYILYTIALLLLAVGADKARIKRRQVAADVEFLLR